MARVQMPLLTRAVPQNWLPNIWLIHGVGPAASKLLMGEGLRFHGTSAVRLIVCEMQLTIQVNVLEQIVTGINVVLGMDAINQLGALQ